MAKITLLLLYAVVGYPLMNSLISHINLTVLLEYISILCQFSEPDWFLVTRETQGQIQTFEKGAQPDWSSLLMLGQPEYALSQLVCKAHRHKACQNQGVQGMPPPEKLHSLRLNLRAFLIIDHPLCSCGHMQVYKLKMQLYSYYLQAYIHIAIQLVVRCFRKYIYIFMLLTFIAMPLLMLYHDLQGDDVQGTFVNLYLLIQCIIFWLTTLKP